MTSSFINALTHTFASDIVNNNIAKTDLGQTNNTNYTLYINKVEAGEGISGVKYRTLKSIWR